MASLGSDLAAIRKDKGLSLEDVQEITRLAPGVLKSIESNAIFEDIGTYTTYKRSYVRSYAKALKIDESEIVEALNQVESGTYQGKVGNIPENSAEADQKETKSEEARPEENAGKSRSSGAPSGKPKMNASKETRSDDNASSIDWVTLGRKAHETKKPMLSKRWMMAIGVLILAALAIFLFFYFRGSTSSAETEAEIEQTTVHQPLIPADTLQKALVSGKKSAASSFTTLPLPDTLSIAVVAAAGKLNPVRVYTDIMAIQRPYWVESHDTLHFKFVDIFRIQAVQKYNRLELIFDGYTIENAYARFYNAEANMIELGRAIIQNHPEWKTSMKTTADL